MSNEYGGLRLYRVSIISPNGNVLDLINDGDAEEKLKSMVINEDMFSSGVHGSLVFRDNGTFGRDLPLIGGEILQLEMKNDGVEQEEDDIVQYRFFVSKVTPTSDESTGELVGTVVPTYWSIEFTGYENIYFNYTEPVIFDEGDDIVKKIATFPVDSENEEEADDKGLVNLLAEKYFNPRDETNSKKDMKIDGTGNSVWLKKNTNLYPFRKPVQQVPVIKLMNYLAENSVSDLNTNAANFLFWQDLDKWNFRSIEDMIVGEGIVTEEEIEELGFEKAGRIYQIRGQSDRTSKLSFQTFTVTDEFSPLVFLDSGAFISEYSRVDPDYSDPYHDFTSFHGSHKSEIVKYSYNEEYDKVAHIEGHKLVDKNFDFEPDIPVRKYDNLHGYYSHSYYNDPLTRLRHDQTRISEIYRKDTNHLGNTAAYNEEIMWQAMFDQTELSAETLKKILSIKKELREKREELARKKDLKERWSAYRCSTCCLTGYNDGSTGPCKDETEYRIVSAGSFSDVVNYDPEDERANENGLFPAYDFENDPELQLSLEELLKLRRPDNIESILFHIDAQIYGCQQAISNTQAAINLCSSNPSPPFYDFWTGGADNPNRETISAPYGRGSYYYNYNLDDIYPYWPYYWYYWWDGYYNRTTIGAAASYTGPLGYGGATPWPCEGCFTVRFQCADGSSDPDYFCDPEYIVNVDVTLPGCILSRGSYVLSYYGNLRNILVEYKENLLSAYDSWIKRKVFVKSKEEYLGIPGSLPLTFQNVKSITRKKIRGSRYEIFAVKKALTDDVSDAYEYLVNYAGYRGRIEREQGEPIEYLSGNLHPYYDQSVNTSIGEFETGEFQLTPIDGIRGGFQTNDVVRPSGWHEQNISIPRAYTSPTEAGDSGNITTGWAGYFAGQPGERQSMFTYRNNGPYGYGLGFGYYYGYYYGRPWWYNRWWWQSMGGFIINRTALAPSSTNENGQPNIDGIIEHQVVGFDGINSWYNRTRYGGWINNFEPQTYNYCNVYDCGDLDNLLRLYQNSMNWYTPAETNYDEIFGFYKSPVRFFQENQHYIRIEFENPIGEGTLSEFPYGFIRDAGIEYYLPYLVQVTPGPFGRHSSSFNISVIGVDPYGFDIAATRTDMNTRNYDSERSPGGTVRSELFPDQYLKNQSYGDYLRSWYRVPDGNNSGINHRHYARAPYRWQTPESDWYNISKFNTVPVLYSMYNDYESALLKQGNTEDYFASRDPKWWGVWGRRYGGYWSYYYGFGYSGSGADTIGCESGTCDEDDFGDYLTEAATVMPDMYLGSTWEKYEWMLWNTNERDNDEQAIWKYDISGESEYGVMTPTLVLSDELERTDYYHELVRNFSGTFVVYAKEEPACSRYECANPDGPVTAPRRPTTEEELETWDPYINCPAQYLRPDAFIDESGELIIGAGGTADREPSCDEIKDLEAEINECDMIRTELGEDYLGCLFSNPKAPNSCNCPEQGTKYKDYLEHSRTYATFWDTPKETPLRREAQMIQFGYQTAVGLVAGDFTLKPGETIYIDVDAGDNSKYPVKRSGGTWMVTKLEHIITSGNHYMKVTCKRDSVPNNLDIEEDS